jgi:hypothetical protein
MTRDEDISWQGGEVIAEKVDFICSERSVGIWPRRLKIVSALCPLNLRLPRRKFDDKCRKNVHLNRGSENIENQLRETVRQYHSRRPRLSARPTSAPHPVLVTNPCPRMCPPELGIAGPFGIEESSCAKNREMDVARIY